jgi:uncharacterized transporter YbjL
MKIKTVIKSIGVVVVGFLVVSVLSTLTDVLMTKIGVFPTQINPEGYASWMYALALLYRTIYTIVGGYVVAYLTPKEIKYSMLLVWILAIIGLVVGILGTVINWDLAVGAHWYPVILTILALPSVWYGGYLKHKRI